MSNIAGGSRNEIVDADNLPAIGQQAFTQVRSEKAPPTRDNPPACHWRPIPESRPADPAVDEAVLAHDGGVENIAAIHYHRPSHHALQMVHVEPAEFVPLRDDKQRVRTIGNGVGIVAVTDAVHGSLENWHRLRIVGANPCAALLKELAHVHGWSHANVT